MKLKYLISGIVPLSLYLLCTSCIKEQSFNTPASEIIHDMLLLEGTKINNTTLTSIAGEPIELSSIVDSISKTVICLYNLDCTSCAEKEIKILKSFIGTRHQNKIMIVANFSSLRKMKIFQQEIGIETYNDKDMDLMEDINVDGNTFIFKLMPDMRAYMIMDLNKYYEFSPVYYDAAIKNPN